MSNIHNWTPARDGKVQLIDVGRLIKDKYLHVDSC